jgi:hypothetical protein
VAAGEAFLPGTNLLAEICFRALSTNRPVSSAVRFGNLPITREISDPDANAMGATWQDGTAVLANGTSLLFETITRPDPTRIRLRLIGAPSGVWQLQGSANLTDWQTVTTVTNDSGLLEYVDVPAGNPQLRFYRAVKPQP